VKMARVSCHRFRSNEVRLWLSVIACNLGNLWRRLVLPQRIGRWLLTSLQQRLVEAGGRLIKHARYYWVLLAESHLTRRLLEPCCVGPRRYPLQWGRRAADRSRFQRRKKQGKERCQRHGSKQKPFQAVAFSEVAKQPPSLGAGGTER
jgi:hypothetical protein